MTHNSAHARIGNPLVKPRDILWDLFGDHLRYLDDGRGAAVPMRVLNRLLDVFGVGESTSRVVLSRMRREGWFTTSRDGRQTSYTLTGRSIRMLDEGRARIFDRGRDDWDGIWRMVIYAVPEESRAERDRVRRTLAWHGFGPLAAATWISPHPRLETVREALADLSATRTDLLESRSLSRAADREMAFRCWDLDGLGRDYLELIGAYEQLPDPAELAALPGPEALRRQVELVASYRTLPFRDPDLPAALLPEGWQGRRAHTLFIAAHDALHGPADAFVRDVVAADRPLGGNHQWQKTSCSCTARGTADGPGSRWPAPCAPPGTGSRLRPAPGSASTTIRAA
jgi:phenylacetic acid degradation operon negative regulatory protein